jgi:DNA-binding protein HU-beta
MNKAELVVAISEKSGLTRKDSEKALRAFEEVVSAELVKGSKVQLVGFGTFDVADRKERQGLNPKTKEAIKIPASKAPRFRAGKALKDSVNS